MDKLNRRQEIFCVEYIKTNGNGVEACRRAGYKDTKALYVTATENLKKPNIKNRIAELSKETDARRIATAKDILLFWAEVMMSESEKTGDRLKASQLLSMYYNLGGENGEKAKEEVVDKLTEIEFVITDGGEND